MDRWNRRLAGEISPSMNDVVGRHARARDKVAVVVIGRPPFTVARPTGYRRGDTVRRSPTLQRKSASIHFLRIGP